MKKDRVCPVSHVIVLALISLSPKATSAERAPYYHVVIVSGQGVL